MSWRLAAETSIQLVLVGEGPTETSEARAPARWRVRRESVRAARSPTSSSCARLPSKRFPASSRRRRLEAERPATGAPGPKQKCHATEREHAHTEDDHAELRGREDEDPPQQRDERGKWVEPHAIGARHVR